MALAAEVPRGDPAAGRAAHDRHAQLRKPPNSLGDLESLGVALAASAGHSPPPIPLSPVVLVAAADHGVHARGVTPWPQTITARMLETICAGGATVNALARGVGARVRVLDVGVATPYTVPDRAPVAVRRAPVRAGTRDLSTGPALTVGEAASAMRAGAAETRAALDAGADLVVPGEMGIANTTAAAALIVARTGVPAVEATGHGTGIDEATWRAKVALVETAAARAPAEPLAALAEVGGLEHAAMAGAVLAAAARRVPVVLDGVSSLAAALVAVDLAPASRDHLFAGHRPHEPGARIVLERLGLPSLLDLELRLGEGTGGVLAVPLVQAAARVLHEVDELGELAPSSEP
ncbi:nicotinate-nucleotide--dimethylbenzimidazole phosphoribosyltransferase [Egibacter rhizosphaerae]|uniref:Nicotinate-nucleotide--dimethylbenzimidazole phosphoribosyltransferase n=1 Tax=Egibacter rhizosphaerae TaxID=1670831 RepID=A0A411YLS3_9ACTN|nr:nicotinate-nucleotide--dimethylbenzimidazole phosphoribosyltransferase [Egibacter rhizosphaerae]